MLNFESKYVPMGISIPTLNVRIIRYIKLYFKTIIYAVMSIMYNTTIINLRHYNHIIIL